MFLGWFVCEVIKLTETIFIKNRKDKNIAVIIEKSNNQKDLVSILNSLDATKEQNQIKTESFCGKNEI